MDKYVKQAGTFGPFLQTLPCYAMTYGMKKVFGNLYFSKLYIFYSENYGACYYLLDEAKKVGDYYLAQVIKNKKFINNEYQYWLADLQRLENLGQEVIKKQDDETFKQFCDLYIALWARSIFVEVYDEDISERILKLAKKYNTDIKIEEIITLTQPKYVSIQLAFEKELVDVLSKKEDVNKLAEKYYFLDVDYLTALPLNVKKRVKEISRRGVNNEKERIKKLIAQVNKDYQKKQTLLKENHFSKELVRMLDFFALMVEWRDVRKKMHQIGGYYVWKYLKGRIRLPKELMPYMTVQDYFKKTYLEKDYIKTLNKRKKHCFVIIDDKGGINWIYEKEKIDKLIKCLEEKEKVLSELRGNVANRGIVKGTARIIKSAKDFKKLKKNEILIAPMTRPEYLPVIKLASAIVTDEGGITCHAAIVSRELNVPCVIGTKIATKILRNGDLIEVNANHGTIKIIKSANPLEYGVRRRSDLRLTPKCMQGQYDLVYKTRTTPFFPICMVAKNYQGQNFKKIFGLNLALPDPVLCVIDDGTVNWFLSKRCKSISKKLFDNFFSDFRYLKNLKKKEKETSQKLMLAIRTSPEKLFENRILSKKGEKKLRKILRDYEEYGYWGDIPGFLFQLYYVDKFQKEFFKTLKRKSEKEKQELFNLILSSPQKTNYERFLLKIYGHILSKASSKELERISKNFYWIIHDYLGEIVDVEYLKKEVKKLKKKPEKQIRKEMEEVEEVIERIRKIKKIEKQLPKEVLKKVKIIQTVLYFYNERKKEVLNKTNIYLRRITEYRFPNKRLSDIQKIWQLPPEEIIQILKGERIKDLKERNKKWVYSLEAGKIKKGNPRYFCLVQPARKTSVLSGSPASPGKAKGKVSVILNISQIPRFKQGNILVAPFTNVNYLPVMRKAKAILTETGGLTSHAAIVSRELKIPCIVGIKDLVLTLKDDDLVTVDAEKGTVKIVKRAK